MNKLFRLMVVVIALVAFGLATMAVAAEFYVVKDAAGKTLTVVDKKPADAKLIVKGPFKTKAEAAAAVKGAKAAPSAKKAIKPPDEGC